jgi:hypothetical protein
MKTQTFKSLVTIIACIATIATTHAYAAETSAPNYTKAVNSYLQQIVTPTESGKYVGTTAIIKVEYGKNGHFTQANVSGAGDISLARMLHQSVNWKSFPTNGTAEATIIVAVNTNGGLEISVQ